MSQLGGWLCVGLVVVSCGGRASGDRSPDEPDGESSSGQSGSGPSFGGSAAGGGGSTGGRVGSSGEVPVSQPLRPRIGGPTPEGDGRLPDIPETLPGSAGVGWDRCFSDQELSPAQCDTCAASRGSDFLVAEAVEGAAPDMAEPQLTIYFDPAQSSDALWLDLTWLSGTRGGELWLWETNLACEPQGEPRLFDVSPLLTGGAGDWSSACIPLDPTRPLQGLALSLTAFGRLGLDALRFGAPCTGS